VADLKEGQFELDGYVFGDISNFVAVQALDVGERSQEIQDTRLGLRGGVAMGRDIELAPEWTFDLIINAKPGHDALISIGTLRKAWQGPVNQPGKLSVLRYNLGGHLRRVFGRPRRFTEVDIKSALTQGVGRILTTFQLADPHYYDDYENGVRINIVQGSTGGLMSPLSAPMMMSHAGGPRAGRVLNNGQDDTPLTVKFHGPVTNPWLEGPGWRLQVNTTLAYDREVTVDARNMTVLLDNGASVAGMLTRTSRLGNLYLPVGYSDLRFGGTDPSGTAYCTVTWRDAYFSL
jgi:hypothetical protein